MENKNGDSQPSGNPQESKPAPLTGGQKVIQPTAAILEELRTESNTPPPAPVASPPVEPQSPTISPALSGGQVATNAQPPSPAQAAPMAPTLINREDAEALAKKEDRNRRLKRLLLIGPVVIIILLAAAFALVKTGLLPIGNFKTITYDNGKGNQFQMKFYADFTEKPAPGTTSGVKELFSKISKDGLYPLTLLITKSSQNGYQEYADCNGPGVSKTALSIANAPTGSTVNLCPVPLQNVNVPTEYLGTMKDGNNYYVLLFEQDVNFKAAASDPASARAALQKVDLSTYNKDITTIVSTIKPL